MVLAFYVNPLVFLDSKCVNDFGKYRMINRLKDILVMGTRAVFHNIKFLTLFWIVNTVFAIVLSVSIFSLLNDSIGSSLISDRLSTTFDYFWYLQFRNIYKTELSQIPLVFYAIVVVYTIIQTFFLGGLVAIFHQPSKNHTVDLFYGGVKYFNRFFKVLLIAVFFYAIAFLINDYLGDFISWIFSNSENVMGEFILRSLRYILLVFLIGVVSIISDYSKISLAIKDKTKTIKGVYYAAIFIKENFNIIFIAFLLVACLGALGVVIYNILVAVIPRTPYYILILSFILQQMLIIFRLFIRMLFCATEVTLCKDLSADIINVEIQ